MSPRLIPATRRLVALDGVRGLLAAMITIVHALDYGGVRAFHPLAPLAVWGFLMLSGCVLARGWDGRWGAFAIRRVVRLWPTHLACLALTWCLIGGPIHAFDVLLFPWGISSFSSVFVTHLANPPTWSLCIEVASILFMPLIALCGRRGFLGLLGGVVVSLLLGLFVHPACLNLVFFLAGAAFSRIRALPCRALESAVPQWLGRISYSLYLAQAPIFVFALAHLGPKGPVLCLPIVLAAAWLMWRAVERPSVAWSRFAWLAWRNSLPGIRAGRGIGSDVWRLAYPSYWRDTRLGGY